LTWLPLAGRVAAALFVVTLLATVYFSFSKNDAIFSPAKPEIKAINDQNKTVGVKQSPKQFLPIQTKNAAGAEIKEKISGKHKGDSAIKTDAFASNHNLEFMVDSRSRSFIIEIYSPINNASFKEGIMFSWREFGRESLTLVILNNRNETVVKIPVSNGRYQFTDKLPPGCYYWKLESANELYYVGKFFIASGAMSPK
jgi:hypothetical protein